MYKSSLLILLLLILACNNPKETAQEVELIDRELFFGNPEKIQVRISPDGKYLSYRAPLNGVMNVWVAPVDQPDKVKSVTKDTFRGIQGYSWSHKPGNLLYTQDVGGDENFHIYLVDVENNKVTDLTPYEEIIGSDNVPLKDKNNKILRPRADILNISRDTPNEILIQMNLSEASNMDVYKIDLTTNEMTLIEKDDAFLQIVVDNTNNVRLATKTDPEGGQIVYKKNEGKWEEYFRVPQEDLLSFGFFGFNKANDKVYMIDSRDRDKASLYTLNLKTEEKTIVAESKKADISSVSINPITYEIEAYAINYLKKEWVPLSEKIKKDFNYLTSMIEGEMSIYMRTDDDKNWIIAYNVPNQSLKYYNYDQINGKAEFILSTRPKLDEVQLSKTYPLELKSRDGQTLISYMTIPFNLDEGGKSSSPCPMVLLVHGGPWSRNLYGFNSVHQWLANRGYVTLSVNYRGSTGFGKNFINIAAKEWAGKMHDDLIDAVNWTIDQGIADKEKIGIMGWSYGGYATLVGLTFTPDVFACGVDIVGPSNLKTLLATIPPYWKSFRDVFTHHIGDPNTEEGLILLEERSPLNKVDKITKPLLIGQGANDSRVKQSESDQIVEAMKAKSIPVTYILYPDEGHGFRRPENNLSFLAITEIFLSKHLGGRYQEIGDDFTGSSIKIMEKGNLKEIGSNISE